MGYKNLKKKGGKMKKLEFLVFLGLLVKFLAFFLFFLAIPFAITLQDPAKHGSTITTFLIMLGINIVLLILIGFLIVKIYLEERSIILLIIFCLLYIYDIIFMAFIIGVAFNLGYAAVLGDFLNWTFQILGSIIATIKKILTSIVQFIH